MTRRGVKDELLDAQTLRTAGSAPYGGADFRTAGVMLMGTPLDSRLVQSNVAQAEAFRRGAALLPDPPEIVRIPYQDTTLPGYFFRAAPEPEPRATVILTGGYDGTAEELYFFNGAAALARGYNVLAFDGPGWGTALLQQGLVLRPDWENVVTPVLDHLLPQPGVDAGRIAPIGTCSTPHWSGSPGRSPLVWLTAGAPPPFCCAGILPSWSASPPPDGRCGEASWHTAPQTPSTTSWACATTQ